MKSRNVYVFSSGDSSDTHRFLLLNHSNYCPKKLLIQIVTVLVVIINQAQAGSFYFKNQFNVPAIPGAQFLSGSDLASDGDNLFILLRFNTNLPVTQQYTIAKTTKSGGLLDTFTPFERGGSLTYYNGSLYRGHEPSGGTSTTEIIRFDPKDGTRLGTIPSPTPSPGMVGGLASDGTDLFAISLEKTIYTIAPDSGAVINTFVPSLPGTGLGVGLAYHNQYLFASTWDTVSMLNPLNGNVIDSFRPGLNSINGITFVNDDMYVLNGGSQVYVYGYVPEPATLLLFGLASITLRRKR